MTGPAFTHPTKPFRAHFIGSTTPRSSPAHYMACIAALLETYRLEVQSSPPPVDEELLEDHRVLHTIPLVINTQGWVKGMGADLLAKVLELAQPTHIYAFQQQQHSDHGASPGSSSSLEYRQHPPPPPPPPHSRSYSLTPISPSLSVRYTPADLRALALLSCMHASPASSPSSDKSAPCYWSTAIPLAAIPPWEIDCTRASASIVLVASGGEDVPPEELIHALSPGLVGLVRFNDPGLGDGAVAEDCYIQGAPAPSPLVSECVGLGLIRFASTTSTSASKSLVIHLVTPVPPASLAQVRVLVKGDMELPVWAMLDYSSPIDPQEGGETTATTTTAMTPPGLFGHDWAKVPFLQWGDGGKAGGARGVDKRRVRRNVMRRGQM